jgi:hypothetical protein
MISFLTFCSTAAKSKILANAKQGLIEKSDLKRMTNLFLVQVSLPSRVTILSARPRIIKSSTDVQNISLPKSFTPYVVMLYFNQQITT